MISGRLKYPIVIEHVESSRDDLLGEEIITTRNISTRSDISWDNESRENDNGDVFNRKTITFLLWHYFVDIISEKDKICYQGKRYYIDSIKPAPESRILYVKAILEGGQNM